MTEYKQETGKTKWDTRKDEILVKHFCGNRRISV